MVCKCDNLKLKSCFHKTFHIHILTRHFEGFYTPSKICRLENYCLILYRASVVVLDSSVIITPTFSHQYHTLRCTKSKILVYSLVLLAQACDNKKFQIEIPTFHSRLPADILHYAT